MKAQRKVTTMRPARVRDKRRTKKGQMGPSSMANNRANFPRTGIRNLIRVHRTRAVISRGGPHLRRLFLPVAVIITLPLVPVGAGAAAPPPTCGGEKATIVGTDGNDVIQLTPGHDVVVALGGDDRVFNPADTEQNHSASDPQPVDAPANDDIVCLG